MSGVLSSCLPQRSRQQAATPAAAVEPAPVAVPAPVPAPAVAEQLYNDRLDNYTEWGIYRGDKKANQYAELAQIHAANVHRLKPVWEYHTGDAKGSSIQCNPIIVDGLMYISTPTLKAVALDAVTGKEVWAFRSSRYNKNQEVFRGRSRGLTYWEGAAGKRVFHFVRDRVYALDAATGALITTFGEGGYIDLRKNLGIPEDKASIEVTSPGIVYRDLLIVGSRVPEGYDSTPGHVRAYNTVTGKLVWIFHTLPRKGQFGYDTWQLVEGETNGGTNPWGGFSLDAQRGWVFFATGSPANDFYGGFRKGSNLFGNCVLALDAATGERKWHYQTVHHDIWDYDNPPAPILTTLRIGGKTKDAVVQLTKMGFTFVLDRETGQPLFPVEERPVPASQVPGEETWPTQPFPLKPAPLVRQNLTEADLTNVTPESRKAALEQFRKYEVGPMYTPPSLRGTLTTPGHLGGVEWGGASFDPYNNIMYVNVNDAPSINRLLEVQDIRAASPAQLGRVVYQQHCTACHGADRKGNPPVYPSLVNTQKSAAEIAALITGGRNLMPAFSQLSREEVSALVAYLKGSAAPGKEATAENEGGGRSRYMIDGYKYFRDPYGAPAIKPPWGTLNAIDLNSGELLWKVPLGEYPKLVARGIRHTGTMNFGGAVATAGGVAFIAATADEKIRAFETHSGKVLWEYQLPAGGYATPSVYMIGGKQYVVIAAGGGGKNGTRSGDAIIAFALPDPAEEQPLTPQKSPTGWIDLFDGKTLKGWAFLNGSHRYTVEDGAIVGRTVEGSINSFLCSQQEFSDFELTMQVMVDSVTNSGVQFRSSAKPVTQGKGHDNRAGRVYGPQVEIRRNLGRNSPTTGVIYGEALGTGWMSSKERMQNGHHHYKNGQWNDLRLVALGPRIQTWLNGHLVEDLVNEQVYRTHPKGFIGLQVHGVGGQGPFEMKWRHIRIRPIARK